MIFEDTRKCNAYASGPYTKTCGENATINGRVEIGVVNVSAQSGFNSSSSIIWTVNKKVWLCGNSLESGDDTSSRIAEAREY
ncbi:hypothetical protein Sme01_06810 [Sphaerisporangium melleum]|uniref:Uncharacterized protein n=1 Tax=Sphaerisporangium melleum TaxID=321316 RepID=A0A917QXH3_9ACTN|nr:hypothetical protein GCM10007964_15390 [Sphaerisporangium melleum]GII68205.1 hypothetical protein Sme01_06810 [Sphaerisporangium melleum]